MLRPRLHLARQSHPRDELEIRRRIGYVPETHQICRWMRVEEVIGFCQSCYDSWNDRTCREMLDLFASFYRTAVPRDSILEKVDLVAQAGQKAATLSGGQAQRLVVGIALIHDPELVILDEPTTGLDPKARRDLHGVIRELRDQGRTTLLTTHYIEEAELLCDRVVMIRNGEIVADGTPFDLVGTSRESSTIWIHVDGPMDPAPLIAAGVEPLGQQGEHHKFATTDPTATILALGDMLRSQGLSLVDLRLKRPTLEDVYLELMGDAPDEVTGAEVTT